MPVARLTAWLCITFLATASLHAAEPAPLDWRSLPRDPAWRATPAARALADSIITYQYASGGWPKNLDMTVPITDRIRAELEPLATIDNGATTTQIRLLAEIFTAAAEPAHRDAALRGIDFLLAAQYPNGGWPQFFPSRKGYFTHITYNDDAMINVMEELRDIAAGKAPYVFVDEPRRIRAADAIERGLACILNSQVAIDGRRLAWAAQHDEYTLEPASARAFEPACFASHESAGIVRYLMSIPEPTPEIIAAVEGAVAWFNQTKLTGIRVNFIKTPEGKDRVVVPDPSAPPIWARFYELGTLRPIFVGRDSVIHYALAEIERERRGGYAWYGDRPAEILTRQYPKWAAKWLKPAP